VCAIIDACVAVRVFVDKNDPDLMKIRTLLLEHKLEVVYGGELAREYARLKAVARIVKLLDQAGIAKKHKDKSVDNEDKKVKEMNLCKSNDTHVIALARVARARLLCSADQGLHTDFKNKKLIDKPRGRIYQNATHDGLLKRKCRVCGKIG
jgi:predicted nucleic acid-binding protein